MAADPGETGSTEHTAAAGVGSARQATVSGDQGDCHHSGGRCNQQHDQPAPKASKFEGRRDDLKGHIYDYASSHQAADQYTKTTREICKYVIRTYKYGATMKTALENLAIPTFDEPEDPAANATRMTVKIWERDIEEYVKKWNAIQKNLKTAFLLIYG
jgi:hypothetical protein